MIVFVAISDSSVINHIQSPTIKAIVNLSSDESIVV